MAVSQNTKAEIVIVAVAGLFLWWLWHKNAQGGAGNGLNLNLTNNPVPDTSGTGFQIPTPLAGDIFQYTGNTVPNPAPLSFGLTGAGSGSCSCATSNLTGATFGSMADLSNWLVNQPGYGAAVDVGQNWF